ncbi:hypothetical protein GR702_19535 [Novosphingobium sp. FGD1]|uniref:Uncharacterized protein n=1 Tax=Novosphingobium silvae TaxID=2692619 RepID=A0A7X4K977_9SPHN|nr:hypothetical protein [Novosphingobium silvae]MYL99955.1 hypothetical protein [Novosphingobium silvae]
MVPTWHDRIKPGGRVSRPFGAMDQNKVDKRVGAQRLAHAHRTFGGRRIVAMAGNQHAIGLPLAGIRPILLKNSALQWR